MAAEMSAVLSSPSAQTLTLGINCEGKILLHDRSAGDVLAGEPGFLLGTGIGELIAGPGDPADALSALIEAVRAGREFTTVLSVKTASRSVLDAVVSVTPIKSH